MLTEPVTMAPSFFGRPSSLPEVLALRARPGSAHPTGLKLHHHLLTDLAISKSEEKNTKEEGDRHL